MAEISSLSSMARGGGEICWSRMASVLKVGSSTRMPSKWTCSTGPPLPICSLSPDASRCLVIRRPLISVPLVEAVSTTNQMPSSRSSSAWWLETLGSCAWSKRTSQSGARPIRSTGLASSAVRPCRLPERCFKRIIHIPRPQPTPPRLRCRAPTALPPSREDLRSPRRRGERGDLVGFCNENLRVLRASAVIRLSFLWAGREEAEDFVAVSGTLAAAVAIAGGHVGGAVGAHHHVAEAAGLVLEIDLVQLDHRWIRRAELHAVQVPGAQRADEQAAAPVVDGGARVERRAARWDRGPPCQRRGDHARVRLASVDGRPSEVRSR